MRSFVATLAAVAASLTPAMALACPVCATREGSGPLATAALGALVVAPWFAAAGVGWWVRRGLLEEAVWQEGEASDQGASPGHKVGDRSDRE